MSTSLPRVDPPVGRGEVVGALFEAVSRFDIGAALEWLHPGFTLELPYEKGIEPLDRIGFATMLTSLAARFGRFRMHVVEAVESAEPDVLVLRYEGDCLSRDGTIAYRNSYVGFFYFTEDLVALWREYTNPMISRRMSRDFDDAARTPHCTK